MGRCSSRTGAAVCRTPIAVRTGSGRARRLRSPTYLLERLLRANGPAVAVGATVGHVNASAVSNPRWAGRERAIAVVPALGGRALRRTAMPSRQLAQLRGLR